MHVLGSNFAFWCTIAYVLKTLSNAKLPAAPAGSQFEGDMALMIATGVVEQT